MNKCTLLPLGKIEGDKRENGEAHSASSYWRGRRIIRKPRRSNVGIRSANARKTTTEGALPLYFGLFATVGANSLVRETNRDALSPRSYRRRNSHTISSPVTFDVSSARYARLVASHFTRENRCARSQRCAFADGARVFIFGRSRFREVIGESALIVVFRYPRRGGARIERERERGREKMAK